jgi:uncharacterized membrane protein (DUF485 family)
MLLDNLLKNIIGFNLTDIAWWMAILFLIVYCIFAFIIVRQVNLLTRTLGTALSPWLKVIAWAHFVISIVILLFAILLI